ncbi:nudix hydrolase 12, mitochondrial isoform X1 [Zea mays]|uniref:Nudix hydrolase 13 n=2 Tax=Zea mays TaxID=4577 RepID=A0A1D6H9C2_MAIZE|nr:nudix hydrolase 12, mitochondrial isoform X1 [Zea mays]AQK71311.1 Nudix hydrolase 13 [Zea mays]|eukprot:XP_008645728.1 nudix hydrolase 12, mitochondrial isoform X1 [Zea mays]
MSATGVLWPQRAVAMSSDAVAEARKGRLKQRYDNEFRLVAGCVPYRVNKKDDDEVAGSPCSSSLGDDTGTAEVEVLMISTPNRADMVFPKGGWEDDEDVYQAASRETMEEAGVKGVIHRAALGHWVFKSKSSQSRAGPTGACKGYIFAMEVTEELDTWPEQDTHDRRWVAPAEAYQLCRYDWMREALTALLERLPVLEPVVAAAAAAATAELTTDQAGMYMMLQATSDGAVALC